MMVQIARRVRGDDDGITLTELIVGMMLTSLALAMIGGFFASIIRSVANGRDTRIGTSIASHAAGELSRVIRTASTNLVPSGAPTAAIIEGTPTTLTIISYVDTDSAAPAPTKVSFAVNSVGNLIETRVAGQQSSGYWVFNGAATTRTIPGPINATSTLFTYYDAAGSAVSPGSAGLTTTQEAVVTSVTISVTAANRTADPVQITTTATMTNLTLS